MANSQRPVNWQKSSRYTKEPGTSQPRGHGFKEERFCTRKFIVLVVKSVCWVDVFGVVSRLTLIFDQLINNEQ